MIIINNDNNEMLSLQYKDKFIIEDNITIRMGYIPEWLKDKKIIGNFNCSFNNLETLENCPQYIEGSFTCNYNNLNTLKGGPIFVKRYYCCHNNNLENLDGIAKHIGKDIFAGELSKK